MKILSLIIALICTSLALLNAFLAFYSAQENNLSLTILYLFIVVLNIYTAIKSIKNYFEL